MVWVYVCNIEEIKLMYQTGSRSPSPFGIANDGRPFCCQLHSSISRNRNKRL